MKCSFELPAKREFTHVNEAGVKYKVVIGERAIASYLTKDEADYIVQAINSYELHKKLVAMLEQYQTDEFWNENPKIAIETLCQAIKGSENPK